MIRRFLGPQPTDKEQEKEDPAPAQPVTAGSASAPAPVTPRAAPLPPAAQPRPTPAVQIPMRANQAATRAKEADVSQRPESLQAVPRVGHAQSDQSVTVIGNGARLEGNLIAAASLRIEGSVNGTITAEGDVFLAPEAEVSADIKATNATLGGRFKGNAVATGTIELTSTARVEGNLTCRSLIVNQGAIFSGQSIMDAGGPKKPAVAASAATPTASTPTASTPTASTPTASSPATSATGPPGGGSSKAG
jgi:cytoskeletal protein CcmA (bactofilin family)